jgi:4-hydroxy-2-oxoheptanedioate aldolase
VPSPGLAFWLETDSQKACEIARLSGFDIVIFDMEHGILDETALDRLVPFCRQLGLSPYVRVSEATQPRIQVALDIGAQGVILPQIKDLEHAAAVVRFAKFPPLGLRGLGYSRTMHYGAPSNEYIARENRDRLCYAMIETPGALAVAADIAALPCVDGLFVGPSDLSLTRGRGVFSASEADAGDLRTVAAVAHRAKKKWAAAASHPKYRKQALSLGPAFLAVADDLSALVAGFESLRKAAGETIVSATEGGQ